MNAIEHVLKKVARLFSLPTCSNSLILSCILIDQLVPFDRDALSPHGPAS